MSPLLKKLRIKLKARDDSLPRTVTQESKVQKPVAIEPVVLEPPVAHFPGGILTLHSTTSDTVDIVFVHGLTGDRERTWTYKNREPWPKTLLPQELPGARILTFGYDANVVELTNVSNSGIKDHAKKLLSNLAAYRRGDKATTERPIIFVCHSLGGLVCQKALIEADKERARGEGHLRKILDCTKGILFLGTPHRGAGLAQLGENLARILGYVKQTNPKIFEALHRNSESLQDIQDDFLNLLRNRGDIQITSFYEELDMPLIGRVVDPESARLPPYLSLSIRQNHVNMTKFSDCNDPGFIDVTGELGRWIDAIPSTLPEVQQQNPPAHVAYGLPSTQPSTIPAPTRVVHELPTTRPSAMPAPSRDSSDSEDSISENIQMGSYNRQLLGDYIDNASPVAQEPRRRAKHSRNIQGGNNNYQSIGDRYGGPGAGW